MTISTTQEVRSAAELERQKRAREAQRARETAQAQAQEAEAQTEAQARQAISETERQTQAARAEGQKEAESRQATIRKQRGQAEREAQTAISKARQARAIEQRKRVLPFTQPRNLGISSYIATVEVARRQAQQSGEDAKATVTKIRDEYFKEVDKAKEKAITDINKQKAGIVKDIREQLASYNADLTKQVAKLSSGIDEWEAEATAAINKAQDEYAAAIQEQLNRPGTEVFADMKSQELIPTNAIYNSYDKETGQLNYTIPDNRTGEEIFAAEQAAGNIPDNAKYKSYNSSTGQLSYEVPKKTGPYLNTAPNTTGPGPGSSNVVTAAGISAMAGAAVLTLAPTGAGVAAIPTPPTWAIGGTMLAVAAIIAIVQHERIAAGISDLVNRIRGATQTKPATQAPAQASNAVMTNNDGSVVYSTAQIRIIPREKGAGLMTFPRTPLSSDQIVTRYDVQVPDLPGFGLTQGTFEIPGTKRIPRSIDSIIIRDPFDVPELRQKGANIMYAAAAVQAAANNIGTIATKELGISRAEYNRVWDRINEAARQAKVAEGRRIIEDMAKERTANVAIQQHLRLAYEEYLRKKAILENARKTYVASLNPQPIKGTGKSSKAIGAAAGVFMAQDIIQSALLHELNKGETMRSAMDTAQSKIASVSEELGLTRQQINAANAAVVYDLAVSTLTTEAVKTASIGQTEGWTDTQLQTKTFNATQSAIKTIVQSAVNTGTLTKTQANAMTQELTRVAEQVTTLTTKIKLPKLSAKEAAIADKNRYPDGTVVWKMGETKRGDEWKIIPPPYTLAKPISSTTPPKGVKKTKGTPQETLTFIGGKVPFKNVSFDLGVTDGFIDVKARTIRFTGEGEQTDVGKRQTSTTKGISLTDNPPLLHQLTKPKGKRGKKGPGRGKITLTSSGDSRNRRPASRGVYTDKQGTRITRRRKKHWIRIY